jgi:hypothetical protein
MSQLVAAGGSLWDLYSDRKKIGQFAESRGLEQVGSKFSRIFGEQRFRSPGSDTIFKSQDIIAMKQYSKFKEMDNILEGIGKPALGGE